MNATIEINDAGFRNELNRLNMMGLDMGRVLKVEGRRLFEDVMRQTYPKQQAQGSGAVKRDLRKLFFPVEPQAIQFGKRSVKKKSAADYVPLWTTTGGKLFGATLENFKPTLSQEGFAAIHKSQRNSRGRVNAVHAQKFTVATDKRTMVNRIIVKRSDFNRYQRTVLTHVGKLRSGFAHTLLRLGVSVPSWIQRNATPETGFVVDNLGTGATPSIVSGNTAAGASQMQGIVDRAVAGRVKAMQTNIARMMKFGKGDSGDFGYAKD